MLCRLALLVFGVVAVSHGAYVYDTKQDNGQVYDDVLAALKRQYRDEARLLEGLLQEESFLHKVNCSGDMCSLCLHVPILGEFCAEVSTPMDTVTLQATKNGIELLSVAFVNKLPKVCALQHFCIMITDIEIKNKELCGSLEFMGKPVIKDACFAL